MYGHHNDAPGYLKVFVGSPEGSVMRKFVPLMRLDTYGGDGSEGSVFEGEIESEIRTKSKCAIKESNRGPGKLEKEIRLQKTHLKF